MGIGAIYRSTRNKLFGSFSPNIQVPTAQELNNQSVAISSHNQSNNVQGAGVMRFELNGAKYFLEFQRKVKEVELTRRVKKDVKKEKITSKYPYTTAKLLIAGPLGSGPAVLYSASVGCMPGDKFSHELGRIMALRKLSALIHTDDLRSALWRAYDNRKQPQAKQVTPASEAVTPKQ